MKTKVVLLMVAAGLLATPPARAQEPVKVGALLSLSGSFASPSKDMLDGMQLSIDHHGGKAGGRAIALVVRDDQAKPELAVEMANRLVRSDHVDFVTGVGLSNIMMAVFGPITRSDTILVGSNAGPAPIAGKDCSPNFFSASYQNDQNAEVMGDYLTQAGVKSVVLLAPNYQAGRDLLAGFKRTFKGKVLDEIYTPLQQTDFSAEISRLKAAAPDAVFVFYPGAWGVQWVKQYSQAGLTKQVPLYSAFTLDEVSIQAIGEPAVGMFSASHWVADIANDANGWFVRSFREKFGRAPSAYAAQGFDSMELIASAVDALGGDLSDKAKTRTQLHDAHFSSVRGRFTYNSNNFPVQDFYLTQVEKQGNELVLKTVAKAKEQSGDSYAATCPARR